jgi:hypothetical protein
MAFTVEYNAERMTPGETGSPGAHRIYEIFATEAEAIKFVAHLPPLRDPVLVTSEGERIRGSALSLHVVGRQDAC